MEQAVQGLSTIDALVLFGTLAAIVGYGTWKTRQNKNLESYLLGGNNMNWATIGLSVMATQASAITFLSTPGKAYESGMEFVQNYFGLPIALIVVSVVFIPLYYKLKVYTAYEFLESRFDVKTRYLGAFLFLLQRGLAAGITIYAPAIILSSILGWNLSATIILVGGLVIVYTVTGGSRAVSLTQKWQMGIIMFGMFLAFGLVINMFPDFFGFGDALKVAGKLGKLEAVSFSTDVSKRYTIWTGLTGGFFLALSYFGTDQSQVARYLTGKNVAASRMGLMFNALFKIPMQFFILFVGVMVFMFYQFEQAPLNFRQEAVEQTRSGEYAEVYDWVQVEWQKNFEEKQLAIREYVAAENSGDAALIAEKAAALQAADAEATKLRAWGSKIITAADPANEAKDYDYVFITFIMNYLPKGVIGLLLAVIFSAAMSSTSGELNALASTTTVDFYKRTFKKEGSESHYVVVSRLLTLGWGILAIAFALYANLFDNLIEAVNILGSLFYGTVLGIFLVAFFLKFVRGTAVFLAAVIAQIAVIYMYLNYDIGYLWFNVIGCLLTILLSAILQPVLPSRKEPAA